VRTIYGPIYTLRPFERGIQETLGKYSRFVMPGLGFQIPIVHVVRVRDIREHTMDIHPQFPVYRIHPQEWTPMADKTSKAKPKRLPKGRRTHIRRSKQAARKAGIAYR
jgi:hypothetical protein